MHIELENLPFKRNTKAIAFKFAYEHDVEQEAPKMVIGYSKIDILSAGKVKARYAYDGSLFEEARGRRMGDTIDLYIENSTYRPAWTNDFGMGYWVVIPESVVTVEKPIEFWIDVVKSEFMTVFNDYPADLLKVYETVMEDQVILPMTVEEWNVQRLGICPEWKKGVFTKK